VAERLSASIIVSHTYGFIFLKTRKTGGSSIEIALRDLCGDIDVITPISEDQTGIPGRGPQNFLFPVMEWPEEDRKKWLRGNRSNRILKRLGFFNHFTAAGARARLGEDIWASYFKFSVERNPWDRQVSYYYHGGPKPSHTKPQSFSDFTRNMPPIDNWSTYAIGEQVVVDHIIRYDHDDLQGGLNKALSHIGLTAPPLARAKGAQRPEGQHYRDYFDDDLREFLWGRHRREIEHFGWAF
jgi:hypothetical protein